MAGKIELVRTSNGERRKVAEETAEHILRDRLGNWVTASDYDNAMRMVEMDAINQKLERERQEKLMEEEIQRRAALEVERLMKEKEKASSKSFSIDMTSTSVESTSTSEESKPKRSKPSFGSTEQQ